MVSFKLLLVIIGIHLQLNDYGTNEIDRSCQFIQTKQLNNRPMWLDISEDSFGKKNDRKRFFRSFRTLKLDTTEFNLILGNKTIGDTSFRDAQSIIVLPLPNGSFVRFRFARSITMSIEEQAKHNIRTYIGQGVDDVYLAAAFDMTMQGFHAMITKENKIIYIEPYQQNDLLHYICYYKDDILPSKSKPFEKSGPIKFR